MMQNLSVIVFGVLTLFVVSVIIAVVLSRQDHLEPYDKPLIANETDYKNACLWLYASLQDTNSAEVERIYQLIMAYRRQMGEM